MEDFRLEYRDNHCEYRVGNWCTKNFKTIKVTINTICSLTYGVFNVFNRTLKKISNLIALE